MVTKSLFQHHHCAGPEQQICAKLWPGAKQTSDNLITGKNRSSRVNHNVHLAKSPTDRAHSETIERSTVTLH